MKTHHILLIILGVVFGLMIGSFLFGISLGLLEEAAVVQEIDRLYNHRFITFVVSLFLFYASYVVTRTMIKRSTREEIFITEGDFGRVSISILAVNDVIRKVFRKFDYVKKYRLDTYVQQKKLAVKIVIKEWDGRSVTEMTDAITAELKAKLHKIMGLEGNIEVHIKINKLHVNPELKAVPGE